MSMRVRMKGLAESLTDFEQRLLKAALPNAKWQKQFETAFKRITMRWKNEAQKRVPVDTSHLKQNMLNAVKNKGMRLIGEVGTNVPYAAHLEFGTDYIAGGKVKALGMDPRITDAQAIHTWAAKEGDAIRRTSHSYYRGDLFNIKSKKVGGPQEQMPFLRPAWMAIELWAIGEIRKVLHRVMKDLKP